MSRSGEISSTEASNEENSMQSTAEWASFFERTGSLLEDEQYRKYKNFLSKSGRGRPSKLQPQLPRCRMLLQMALLHQQTNSSWEDVEELFHKITRGNPLQGCPFRHEIESLVKKGINTSDADMTAFLDTHLTTYVEERHIGPHLLRLGILRQHLLHPDQLKTMNTSQKVTNGMVINLLFFCNQEPTVDKRSVLNYLGTDTSSFSDRALRRRLKKAMAENNRLQRNVHREDGQREYDFFLSDVFTMLPPPATHYTDNQQVIASAPTTTESLRQTLVDREEDMKAVQEETDMLKQVVREKTEFAAHLQQELEKLKKRQQALAADLQASQTELRDTRNALKNIRASNHYKKLRRNEKSLSKQEATILLHKEGGCEKKMRQLRRDKKLLQTKLSNARKAHERFRMKSALKVSQLEQAIKDFVNSEEVPNQEQDRIIRLKVKNGNFTQETKICIMSLVGECEVPAHRCGKVIETVIHQILKARVLPGDLPSQRSALRCSDQAHALSKMHVAEVMKSSEHYDLHIDGASRYGQKYVTHQINTKEGTFSLGFVPVATENSSTLVEVSIDMLEELSDLHGSDEAPQVFVHMLSNLSAVMSDRAAVMKAFGKRLQEERKVLLSTDEGLDFLHCNAHFLLGLSSEVKKVLNEENKHQNDRTVPVAGFRRPSECLAFRYIRMACDCLGPRGDDKSGCRAAWQAFCLMVQQSSTITSFRENRFNNIFQAAASLHYHRQDIEECLQNFLPMQNRKIAVVLSDCRNEDIDCHIIALGLLYFRVTGPYWSLLGSQVHYLNFYKQVENLHEALQQWQDDASPMLGNDCQTPFQGITFHHNPDILRSLLSVDAKKGAAVKGVLERACGAMLRVTERQLRDFLPNGKYNNVQDDELKSKLAHSLITNIVSEECFADLDFSLFRRRSCSLHHHSSINMMKRNKTISSWLAKKSREEQERLLKISADKSLLLRQKHCQAEKAAVTKQKDILIQLQQDRHEADEKNQQKIMQIMNDLHIHHGPCTKIEHVSQLLDKYSTRQGLTSALRAEILFQKMVLQNQSSLLKVSGSALTLLNRLRELFGGQPLEKLPALRKEDQRKQSKRARLELQCEAKVGNDASFEEERGPHCQAEFETDFKFSSEGEVVAVYFVEDFFIGEVCQIHNDKEAEINFLEKAGHDRRNLFRWPCQTDSCRISSAVIFAKDLALVPSSSSGRSFIVASPSNLRERYEAFKMFLTEKM